MVGLTGYGNGLFLVDRDGRPVRNAILSPDQRARAILARWRAEGAEARSVQLTYNSEFPGKPLPLIAWLDAHEPEFGLSAPTARSSARTMCAFV